MGTGQALDQRLGKSREQDRCHLHPQPADSWASTPLGETRDSLERGRGIVTQVLM